ncbi:conserved hypothetical protein [Trichinella spiralis]|uniref:hypothetical protein n=1 Tax=Trichinella spiralis TaxID=6334 RepID=UPI0001EFD2C1|nr:conserved hypothetical protein [Trichinella spiralis]
MHNDMYFFILILYIFHVTYILESCFHFLKFRIRNGIGKRGRNAASACNFSTCALHTVQEFFNA